jgi:hypothetical protein
MNVEDFKTACWITATVSMVSVVGILIVWFVAYLVPDPKPLPYKSNMQLCSEAGMLYKNTFSGNNPECAPVKKEEK